MFKLNIKEDTKNFNEIFKLYKQKNYQNYECLSVREVIQNGELLEFQGLDAWKIKNKDSIGEFVVDGNEVFFEIKKSGERFPLILKYSKGLKLLVKSLEESLKNTNYEDLLKQDKDQALDSLILDRVYSRYRIYAPYNLLKNILGVKWADKNDLKRSLKRLDEKYHFTTKMVKTKKGNLVTGISTKKLLFPLSISGVRELNCDWKQFEEEYSNGNSLFIQGGESGIVFSREGSYETAFIEVFPKFIKNYNGELFSAFVRGEGKNLYEAEKSAFEKLKRIKRCNSHNWERVSGRKDGYAKCVKCGVYKMEFEPLTRCCVCDKNTKDRQDKDQNIYCLHHYFELSEDVAIDMEKESSLFPIDEQVFQFKIDKMIFEKYKNNNEKDIEKLTKTIWRDILTPLKVKHYPLFGKPLISKEDYEKLAMKTIRELLNKY